MRTLTLMLELSMFSKSSAEMVGTLLTKSIRKRPTLLSAVTFPDWGRVIQLAQTLFSYSKEQLELTATESLLTSTSSMYASTVVSMSWTRAAAPATWDRSEVSPLVRLRASRVRCRRSTKQNKIYCILLWVINTISVFNSACRDSSVFVNMVILTVDARRQRLNHVFYL